ncbi:pyruvate kinase [Amylibacter marinus]|uniref:Pyruvate kinase n=1 Tax=Amylibacter marinus TaxID=1475483 RepID=A0ABQ5VVY3_9RHOB|nr:pyruvate kinase [Amylibacter marinus]GLQ35263.1 pyruvate kinase [Amylibacter marinus]
MRRMRNVKVVATLGPASDSYGIIKQLYEEGVDVFRLNMSHGAHSDMRDRYQMIRDIERDLGRPICILADLQGPKLRCGVFANGKETIVEGQDFRFDLDDTPGDATRVQLPHKEIFEALEVGATLLINDGKLRVVVKEFGPDYAVCEVKVGGEISNKKGVNVPELILPLAALTEKDKKDLEFVCSLGVDWLALSFVQRPEDVEEARALADGRAAIMVKVEKPACVKAFDDVLAVADGVMVARGDLGVELPVQDVPPIQKRLVAASRRAGKPVVVATQMMESMIESPVPTRAEVSDVATAIYDGADAVMLSAESAAGKYPIEAVKTMHAVAISVEADATYRTGIEATRSTARDTVADAITAAAREIAETTEVKAICCFSSSGTTALLAARERPKVPIIALTPKIGTARRLGLVWGLHCVQTGEVGRFKHAVVSAARAARSHDFATNEDKIVVTAGIPFNTAGSTNIIRVAPVDEKSIFEGEAE